MSDHVRTATVLTHGRPEQTGEAMERLIDAARDSGVELRIAEREAIKQPAVSASGLHVIPEELDAKVDVCLVLGGDGTILRALRKFAGTGVPVFAINFGEVGFLATVDPEELDGIFEKAFTGDYDRLPLPAIAMETSGGTHAAINDISINRRPGGRVASLAYGVNGQEVGYVRCDGLVVCTPAGSTGYNLANGGPVMAWGVEGMAVSFIAPHSLTARALVAAPDDTLEITSHSREAVDIAFDGRPAGGLEPEASFRVRYMREASILAQVPGSSFYRRLREKFGRMAS